MARKPLKDNPPAPESSQAEHSDPPPAPAPATVDLELEADDVDFTADEAELGADSDDYSWHLSRALPNGKGYEKCRAYPRGELHFDELREEWGSGRYHARLRAPNGAILKHRVFTLAAPRARPEPIVLPAPVPAGQSELARELREALAPMLEMNKALLAAVAGRPAGETLNPTQLLDLALRMAERMTPKPAEHRDPLELLKEGMKLAAAATGTKDLTDVMISGIETLKPVATALAHKLEGPGGPAELAGPNGNGTAQPSTNTRAIEANPMLELVNWLQRNVRWLLPKAAGGKSPSLYAELMLDNLPPGVTADKVLEALKRPGALDQLLAVLPSDDRVQAQTHKAWFEALQHELIGFLEEAIAAAAPPAGAAARDAGEETSDTREA